MEKDVVIEALTLYKSVLKYSGYDPKSTFDGGNDKQHVAWMCDQAMIFVKEGRRDKALKWLGFIQGCLFCWKVYSLEELKDHNRNDA